MEDLSPPVTTIAGFVGVELRRALLDGEADGDGAGDAAGDDLVELESDEADEILMEGPRELPGDDDRIGSPLGGVGEAGGESGLIA